MRRSLQRFLATGIVWLTAAATLFGSMPQVECRCVDGRVKVFCALSLLLPSAPCCSVPDDEVKETAAEEVPTCCNKHQDNPAPDAAVRQAEPSEGTSASGKMSRDSCSQRLSQLGACAITYTEAPSIKVDALALGPVDFALSMALPGAPVAASLHPHGWHAPPPDLVILLVHLLI
jgi:hypothetical protein